MLAKEYEFEIKEEPRDENSWYSTETVQTAECCIDCAEKQETIDSLTAKNQRLEGELQDLKKDLDAKSQSITELEMVLKRKESAHKIEIEEMNLKMQHISPKYSNESLDESSKNEPNDQYDVEKLLNHKIKNGDQMFFVKWKGYDNRHNSWVKRSDLSCKKILQKYLKSHKLD